MSLTRRAFLERLGAVGGFSAVYLGMEAMGLLNAPAAAQPFALPQGSAARFGDTAAQTRSILRKIEAQLRQHQLDLGDVVMMRVFLVAPAGQEAMDFAGMMTAYREFFGTADQPNKPARSTMEVSGLVDPGWLVEIEVTAAGRGAPGVHRAGTGR